MTAAGKAGAPASEAAAIVDIVRRTLGRERVPALHEPVFAGREWDYLKDCLDTGMVSSVGAYVDRFESMLADIAGVKRAVAVVNGTAALHVCLLLADVRRDDEVLIPSLTFVATANAVAYCGAVPHFADAEEKTLGVDAEALRAYLGSIAGIHQGECRNRSTGRRIRALMPMHAFGHPSDLDALARLCADFRLILIEDAAEALGSKYKGRHVGGHGLLSALSFNGNKIVTTGGGGAILTQDEELGKQAKHLTTTAKLPHKWAFFHDRVGYNYRLPNLNAALGCAQLEMLPAFLARKRALAKDYQTAFAGFPAGRVFAETDSSESNYWLNVLLLDPSRTGLRDETLALADAQGMAMRPAWIPLHRLPMYSHCPRMELAGTENLERRILNLPSGAGLKAGD